MFYYTVDVMYHVYFQGMSQFQLPRWDMYGPTPYVPVVPPEPLPPRTQALGEVTDFVQNEECFRVSLHLQFCL